EAARRSPVSAPRRESAVIWQQIMPLTSEGTLTTTLQLPQLTGELRLMAVAVEGDRYGSAERPLTVTAPLLVEMACPRFAAPGDTFDIPVKVFNTTDKPLLTQLEI